jgi:HAD superfamily hydrolase (TIGR01509 family)
MTFFPKAVIFDMDGLLVDSEPVWGIVEREMLARRGKTWNFDIQNQFIGMRANDFLAGMIRDYGLSDTVEALRHEVLTNMVSVVPHQVVPRPGARELLHYLKSINMPCAIASSSARMVIDAVVESQGWSEYLPLHVSGDEVPLGKPAPDIYVETARQMGYDPADCLALEDSPNGARAAVAAGMVCYAVPDASHSSHSAFDNITPYVYDSLHDVQEALQRAAAEVKS